MADRLGRVGRRVVCKGVKGRGDGDVMGSKTPLVRVCGWRKELAQGCRVR